MEYKKGNPIHVVAGVGDGKLWIITAYFPRSYLKTQNNCLFLLIRAISSRKILEIRQYFSVFSLELASY